MLRLFLNGELFWSANIDECPSANYAIYDLKGSYKIDGLDTLSFTILRTHPMFSKVRLKRATFLLHDNEVLFLGKVSDKVDTYDFRAEVTCEELLGATKDDYWGPKFLELTDAQRVNYNTVDKLLAYTLKHLNRTEATFAGINSSWPNFPQIKKGFTMYTGEAKDIQEFDLGCKSLYDIMFDEIISKCGGYWRVRPSGSLTKMNGKVVGYELKKVVVDYLSSEADFDIDPSTGLLYDHEAVDAKIYEPDPSGANIEDEPLPEDDGVEIYEEDPIYDGYENSSKDIPAIAYIQEDEESIKDGSVFSRHKIYDSSDYSDTNWVFCGIEVVYYSTGGISLVDEDDVMIDFKLECVDEDGSVYTVKLIKGHNPLPSSISEVYLIPAPGVDIYKYQNANRVDYFEIGPDIRMYENQ